MIDRYQRKFSFVSINARNTGGAIDIPVHTDNWLLDHGAGARERATPEHFVDAAQRQGVFNGSIVAEKSPLVELLIDRTPYKPPSQQ